MKKLIIILVILIISNACKKESFEYVEGELSGTFKPNNTANLAASYSCVANPDVSFGEPLKLEKISENVIVIYTKIYNWDAASQKTNELDVSTEVTLKPHDNHIDLIYKNKVVGDYRVDKIYKSATNNKKFIKGKILNIRLEDNEEKKFIMFRGSK